MSSTLDATGNTTGSAGSTNFDDEGPPRQRCRPGGPKEVRLNRVRLMETGRYYEAAIARGEKPEDPDAFYSLRVHNLPLMTTEEQLQVEFEAFGKVSSEPKKYPFPCLAFSNSKESTPLDPIKI